MSEEHLLTVGARGIYANFTLVMVEVGIHLFMALYGLSVFLETPEPLRKGRKRYIAVSFIITALRAMCGSLDMANYFQVLFRSTSVANWYEVFSVEFSGGWKYAVSSTLVGLGPMIGDVLLVYRCYIVCVEYWWVTILPLLTSISALILFYIGSYEHDRDRAFSEVAASTFLTVFTNIIVTTLITFRLIHARKSIAKLMPTADTSTYTGVIAILIESAAPLTIFGIISAILQQLTKSLSDRPDFTVCRFLFEGLFYSFCALSPHMIIFRVTTGRSFTRLPTPKDGALSNPIQFAHQTAESSFLDSTLDREVRQSRDIDPERGLNPTRPQT